MRRVDTVQVAYAFRNGAHSFQVEDPATGAIAVSHGVPEVAYEQVTRTLSERATGLSGRRVVAHPALPFDDFFNWLRQNPIASVAGAPVKVEFAWELR
jgi:hypothetical protein